MKNSECEWCEEDDDDLLTHRPSYVPVGYPDFLQDGVLRPVILSFRHRLEVDDAACRDEEDESEERSDEEEDPVHRHRFRVYVRCARERFEPEIRQTFRLNLLIFERFREGDVIRLARLRHRLKHIV